MCNRKENFEKKFVLASGDFFIIVNDKFTQYYMYQEANGIFMVYIYGIYQEAFLLSFECDV